MWYKCGINVEKGSMSPRVIMDLGYLHIAYYRI
jgi:hypothetical protein